MKKIIVYLLIAVFVFSVNMPVVYPAQSASVTAKVDYENDVINVEYNSNLSYDCYVTFYLVKASKSANFDFSNEICRMKEVSCKANKSVAVQIKCGDDLGGEYDVFAVPTGKSSEQGSVKTTITIIDDSYSLDILKNINNAAQNDMASVIYDSLAQALEFKEQTCPTWKNEYLFAMKNEDNNGTFSTFSEIGNAWLNADSVLAINQATTVDELQIAIEGVGSSIGLDIKNSDYVSFKENFIKKYMELLNGAKPKSVSATVKAFNQAAAITAFNERNTEGKADAINEYWSVLNLDIIKTDVNKATPAKIARNLDGFKVNNIDELFGKIKSETEKINNTKDVITDIRNESPKGSGSSGGGGGKVFADVVTVPADAFQTDNNTGFKDVDNNYWAKQYIENLVAMNVINGYQDGTFRGENIVTREEFIKMVVSAFGLKSDATINFTDVSNDFWASESIKTAVGCGVINGISETEFGVGKAITRQDMAVIIDRTLSYLGITLSNEKADFTDGAQIADYAVESISRLGNAGVINGFADGSFMPETQLTRAQAAKVISVALDVR